jgi:pyruvate,water dikinase
MIIESHYERPMDIECALDGVDDKLYIVQARPETVKSRLSNSRQIEKFHLKETSSIIIEGRAIGQKSVPVMRG